MSYTRDPDHYTRGVGAVQAVDKVLARQRGVGRARRDAAIESQRRDRLKAKLMRPALGMVKLPTFGRTGSNMAPVVTSGGVIEGGGTIGGGGAVNAGGTFGTGGGGGGVSPTNTGGVRGRLFTNLQLASTKGAIQPMTPPTYVGICVDAQGNKIACPAPAAGGGTTWNPNGGFVPPLLPPAGSGSGPVTTPPAQSSTDTTVVPTSSVGTVTGGGGGGGTPTTGSSGGGGGGGVLDAGPTDDSSVLVPTQPDYQKYALYAGVGIAAYLLLKSMSKGR